MSVVVGLGTAFGVIEFLPEDRSALHRQIDRQASTIADLTEQGQQLSTQLEAAANSAAQWKARSEATDQQCTERLNESPLNGKLYELKQSLERCESSIHKPIGIDKIPCDGEYSFSKALVEYATVLKSGEFSFGSGMNIINATLDSISRDKTSIVMSFRDSEQHLTLPVTIGEDICISSPSVVIKINPRSTYISADTGSRQVVQFAFGGFMKSRQ